MERVKGIEPSYEAWEAAVLPLNYTRMDAVPAQYSRRQEAKYTASVMSVTIIRSIPICHPP
jgi:hypothetical protein